MLTNKSPLPARPLLARNLSVEEENLGALPFAVLERRVGKRVGKLDIVGKKILPDGTEVEVLWQVQGNNELGLPTEQDLDIFVALGVLTFQNNFAKTVTFTGRELAKILNINSVHGKFYQRLKLAMDRFIPLRFRALMRTDRHDDVKWVNVFQEASFSLDRTTGRCTGQVTWTDKLIQSMDNGFFRLLDASRYMQLDGLTAKHLYRFLTVAFESTDVVIIDARELAKKHLGIVTLPQFFSRLLQTLEPAFDQLIKIGVLSSYNVVETESWRIALRRHASYVPERKSLLQQTPTALADLGRGRCISMLEKIGLSTAAAETYAAGAATDAHFYALQRAALLYMALREEQVLGHVALSLVKKALDGCPWSEAGRDQLDWCEIAIETCRRKKAQGQKLTNAAGLIVKILRDTESRDKLVTPDAAASFRETFARRERACLEHAAVEQERDLVLEYEEFRRRISETILSEMPPAVQSALRKRSLETLQQQGRFEKMSPPERDREAEDMLLLDVAKKEAPSFEKWRLRRQAAQAALPFMDALAR
jgi:3'-phosphoadenosine 5'-phosphosulfate sulfotransferase